MNKTYDRVIISLVAVTLTTLTVPAAARQSFQGVGDLPGGIFQSFALGVSADGSVVVGSSISDSSDPTCEAFRWTSGGGMVGLGDLLGGGFSSLALGVSADGSVVVGQSVGASGFEAFRWTSGDGMVGLGDLPGGSARSYASGASADGSVVVGHSTGASGVEAFRWTSGGGMVGLGDLPGGGFRSLATGVSADGSVVVGRGVSATAGEAFIWDPNHGMQSLQTVLEGQLGLDLTGWTLDARSVSADGTTIVGIGINPLGFFEGFIAIIPCLGDSDCDGIDNDDDECPDSDLSDTVVIGGVDTNVDNDLQEDGCTIADLINDFLVDDPSTGEVVQFLIALKAEGIISGRDMGAILKAVNSSPP